MKTYFYTLFIVLIFGFKAFSQEEEESDNAVNPKKIAFLTNRLKLSSEQAKIFWPVYEEFDKERKTNRQAIQQVRNRYSSVSSDDEVKTGLQEMAVLRQKGVDVEKRYVDKFFKVISPKQTVELYKAEIDWQDALIGAIQDKTAEGQTSDKITEKKTDFLSGKMKLTPEQAKQFWVVYVELEKDRKSNRQALSQLRKALPNATDEQVKSTLKDILDIRQKGVDNEKRQMDRILKIITPRQTAAMYKGEIEFQRELIREIRERRQQMKEKQNPAETKEKMQQNREKMQQNREKIQDNREKRQNLKEKN